MREEQLRFLGPAVEQLAGDLHQRRYDQVRCPSQDRELLAGQADRREDERNRIRPAQQASLAGLALRLLGECIAPGSGHRGHPLVRRGAGPGELEEMHAQIHGARP